MLVVSWIIFQLRAGSEGALSIMEFKALTLQKSSDVMILRWAKRSSTQDLPCAQGNSHKRGANLLPSLAEYLAPPLGNCESFVQAKWQCLVFFSSPHLLQPGFWSRGGCLNSAFLQTCFRGSIAGVMGVFFPRPLCFCPSVLNGEMWWSRLITESTWLEQKNHKLTKLPSNHAYSEPACSLILGTRTSSKRLLPSLYRCLKASF